MKALKEHGFLIWIRRCECTGEEGRGPQIRQVSNAYGMRLPGRALRLVGHRFQSPPLPDDVIHAWAEAAAVMAAWEAALGLDEWARHKIEDEGLGRLLGEFGRHIGQRESTA